MPDASSLTSQGSDPTGSTSMIVRCHPGGDDGGGHGVELFDLTGMLMTNCHISKMRHSSREVRTGTITFLKFSYGHLADLNNRKAVSIGNAQLTRPP